MKGWRLVVWGFLGLHLAAVGAAAHPLAPALLELTEGASGKTAVLWRRPLLLPPGARLEPVLPAFCRGVVPPVERLDPTAFERRLTLDCGKRGLRGATLAVSGLDRTGSEVVLRVTLANGESVRTVLRADAASYALPAAPQGWAEVGGAYLRLGIEHLVSGWDHLAFVLALVLLVGGGRRLVATITAFTLGHSLTLSLAALGFVRLPPAPIEAAIALSILIVAVELARERPSAVGQRPSLLGRRPWLLAAGFGLLHGLGFAGALAQVGLPAGEIPLALFGFNLGIELGQLAVVALCLAVGVILRASRLEKAWSLWPRWSSVVPAYGLGTLAAFWLFERLAGW